MGSGVEVVEDVRLWQTC